MRVKFLLLVGILLWGSACVHQHQAKLSRPGLEPFLYIVDLNDRADDLFKVEVQVNNLTQENAIYQFASTAPGTYQTMNIGRFVRNFQAFDAKGQSLEVTHPSVNQWQFSDPSAVAKITYQVAETWDTAVDEFPVYPMGGTSIEKDHVQIMPHATFGYPTGMQAHPLSIRLKYPKEWLVGTALPRDKNGDFQAESFDHAVDSPILMGKLTHASLNLDKSLVDIYTYSASGKTTSQQILDESKDIFEAVKLFLKGFPVDRYTMLFLLDDKTAGAWEHSYSSNYVISDNQMDLATLDDITAHEIFHVFTPLNLHSEIIESFNFVEPVPSTHLWLYEATTEWAAQIIRLRGGTTSFEGYLGKLSQKLRTADLLDPNLSLTDLARSSYTKEGASQYGNIYMRGAFTMGLLDIRLLELSGGKRGLREVLLDLAAQYGKNKPFSEATFFDDFTKATYPEVRDFMKRYLEGAEPLPIKEYYAKIGINYEPVIEGEGMTPSLGFQFKPLDPERVAVQQLVPALVAQGLAEDDVLVNWDGAKVDLNAIQVVVDKIAKLKPGDGYTLTVRRGDKELDLKLVMQEVHNEEKHVFSLNKSASAEQVALREIWQKNQ